MCMSDVWWTNICLINAKLFGLQFWQMIMLCMFNQCSRIYIWRNLHQKFYLMQQHFFNAADFICIIEFYLMQQNFFNAAEFLMQQNNFQCSRIFNAADFFQCGRILNAAAEFLMQQNLSYISSWPLGIYSFKLFSLS